MAGYMQFIVVVIMVFNGGGQCPSFVPLLEANTALSLRCFADTYCQRPSMVLDVSSDLVGLRFSPIRRGKCLDSPSSSVNLSLTTFQANLVVATFWSARDVAFPVSRGCLLGRDKYSLAAWNRCVCPLLLIVPPSLIFSLRTRSGKLSTSGRLKKLSH